MNKLLLLAMLCLAAGRSAAQPTLTLAQQQEDFTIFRTSLQEMHAGLNWFITPERFNTLHDSVYATLKENDPAEQFYLKLRYCMGALKHGHDGLFMTNQESGINYKMWALPKSRKHLPFVLSFLGERLFIMNNCGGNTQVTNGSEIISINGRSVKTLAAEFCNYIFANGHNTTFKYRVMGFYYQFHYLLQALYPADVYTLDIIPFNKKKKMTVRVNTELPQTIADKYKTQTGRDINEWGELLEYRLLDSVTKTGYLKLETFSAQRIESGKIKFPRLLDSLFRNIRKDGIQHLVVDVRNNEGGDDSWQLATSYFRGIPAESNGGLPYLQSDRYSQTKYVLKDFQNRALLAAFEKDPYQLIDKTPDGRFRLKPQFTQHDTREKPLQANAYNGKVFILQNGMTFSAGFAFAEKVKELMQQDSGFVKVVGEDNGNDRNAGVGSGGWDLTVQLPNSKINCHIPITGGGTEKAYMIKPVQFLDYKVIPTITDRMKGVDTEVEFVKKLIKSSR
jgi:hypothetical protein